MAIALFTLGGVLATLLSLNRWLVDADQPRRRSRLEPAGPVPAGVSVRPLGNMTSSPQVRPARPLRVVRCVEASQAPASAGRMFISGRMADVCAELDRLAASET
jgi:hypothetical protein